MIITALFIPLCIILILGACLVCALLEKDNHR